MRPLAWWVSEFSGKWNVLAAKEFFLCFGEETLQGYAADKAGIVVMSKNFRLLINAMHKVQLFLKPSPSQSFVL